MIGGIFLQYIFGLIILQFYYDDVLVATVLLLPDNKQTRVAMIVV